MLHPEGLAAGSKPTTLAEIEARGGVELARLAAIDKAARDLINSGPSEWCKRLAQWPGIDPAGLVPNWDRFAEIFYRRNVLTHGSGRVDEKYLTLTRTSGEAHSLGESLHCDYEYVVESLELVLSMGRGLAATWLPKLLPNDGFEFHRADEIIVQLLEHESWDLAATLSGAFLARSTGEAHLLKVNNWMARRELSGSTECIESEVLSWVPPSDDLDWRVARAALLESCDEVRELLVDCAARGNDVTHFEGWPLIKRLRRTDRRLDLWLFRRPKRPR